MQLKVKADKKMFDKLKGDVIQKIDLLSASRCNLLSATLEPYQSSMVKFLNSTAESYNSVFEQYKGHPSYQFNILKHIIPNNGIVDEDDEDLEEGSPDNKSKKKYRKQKSPERAKEVAEDVELNKDDSDDKLISFDASPSEENPREISDQKITKSMIDQEKLSVGEGDLLGGITPDDNSPGFGNYTEAKENNEGSNFVKLILCSMAQYILAFSTLFVMYWIFLVSCKNPVPSLSLMMFTMRFFFESNGSPRNTVTIVPLLYRFRKRTEHRQQNFVSGNFSNNSCIVYF